MLSRNVNWRMREITRGIGIEDPLALGSVKDVVVYSENDTGIVATARVGFDADDFAISFEPLFVLWASVNPKIVEDSQQSSEGRFASGAVYLLSE